MPRKQTNDPVFTPELIRILKIFGVLSIGIVLALSFFDSKRANNTGKDQAFRMADSDRLYFLNVRALSYDREVRADANMTLFRHDKRSKNVDTRTIDLVLILNTLGDEAYLYLEPRNLAWPLVIVMAGEAEPFDTLRLENGNKTIHLEHIRKLEEGIRGDYTFQVRGDSQWLPLWAGDSELEYLETVLNDYNKLLNKDE